MNVKQSAQQLAKSAAKKVAQESLEVLKSAREQVAPIPETTREASNSPKQEADKGNIEQKAAVDKQKSTSMLRAYENEISDIRREEVFKDLQRRISEGEDVSVLDYSELTAEQKQVLMAQQEAMKAQKTSQKTEIPQISSKKGRRTFGNIGVKRSQTQVEMRQPPSS